MDNKIIKKTICGSLSAILLFCQNPAMAQEIYRSVFPAGAANGLSGPIEFITIGEPVIHNGAGVLSGLGFAHTIPAKASTLSFVNTPTVAAVGAESYVSVEVLNHVGQPINNMEVVFSRFSGAELLETTSARTDQDGVATVVYKSAASETDIIQAQVFGLPSVSQKILWIATPSGSLTGLPTTDDGIQPHVLGLGNNQNMSSAENSWGKHWSQNDIVAFSVARREMNYTNGMLFPQDFSLKKAWKGLKKGWKKLKNSVVGKVLGVLTLAVGILITMGGGGVVGLPLVLLGSGLIGTTSQQNADDDANGNFRENPDEEFYPPITDPNIPQDTDVSNYCTISPALNTGYKTNFNYTLTNFQSSYQSDIAGNALAQPAYNLLEKGSSISTAADKFKIASVNSGLSRSGELPGALSNFQVSRPATITNLGPVGGNNLLIIQDLPFSKSIYNIKPPSKTNWAEQSLNSKIDVRNLATGSWGGDSLKTTLHGQTNSMMSGKNQWLDSGIALNTNGKAIQWSNALGKDAYQELNDFNPQKSPFQPIPALSASGEPISGGESQQDNVFNIMSKSDRAFKGVNTYAGLTPNPVNTLTGNLIYSVEDTYLPGRSLFIQFVRFYNNLNAYKNGPFGYGWTHNYNMALDFRANGDIVLEAGDGGVYAFLRNDDGTYKSANGVYSRLVKEGDIYALVHKHGARYIFNEAGGLQRIADTNGNEINLIYSNESLVQIVDPSGRFLTLSYDSYGHIVSLSGPGNQFVSYEYGETDNLENVQYPSDKHGAYTYNASHLMLSYNDAKSQTGMPKGIYQYDEFGRIAAELDSAGTPIISLDYSILSDGSFNTTLTDAKGKNWIDRYDGRGFWASRKNPLGDETQYKWNNNCSLIELAEPDGKRTQITRDDRGNALQTIYADGSKVTRQYDPTYNRILMETSPLGYSTVYTYDNQGNVVSARDPENNSVGFSYDEHGSLVEYTDQMGRKTSVRNDINGNVEQVTGPDGGKRIYTYTVLGTLASTTDENGYATSFTWSPSNELERIDYPDNSQFKMTYDAHGYLSSEENGNGAKTIYTYDEMGKISHFTDAEGGVHSFEYDANGLMTVIKGPLGNTNTLSYDDLGRLIRNTDTLGAVHEIGYDKSARETSIKDARGNMWRFDYDLNGLMSKITQPDETVISLQYNANDQVVAVESALGAVTQFNYDKSGQLVEKINPEGKKELFQRDAIGNITSYTNPAGSQYRFSYNATDELTGLKDPEGREWVLTRNGTGDITALRDPLGSITQYTYTPMGEIASYTDSENNTWAFSYDAEGNLTTAEDPLGRKTEFRYSPLNQPIEQKDPEGNTINYAYDINGNMTQVRTSAGTILNFTYDLEGRMLSMGDSEGGTQQFKYDLSGNLIEKTDPNGNAWKFGTDPFDRLVSITDPANAAYVFNWDAGGNLIGETDRAGNTWNYSWSPTGKLETIIGPGGYSKSYEYNALGYLTKISRPPYSVTSMEYDSTGQINTWIDPENRKTVYTHDNTGRLTSLTDSGGNITSYKRDKNGRVVEIINPLGASTRFRYDSTGNIVSAIDPAGRETSYSYDKNNRRIKHIFPDQTYVAYAYNGNGDLLTKTDQMGNVTNYVYDSLLRLISKISSDNHISRYEYDRIGNMVSATDPMGNAKQYFYDVYGRLVGERDPMGNNVAYQYDANGNQTAVVDAAGARTVYEYDALNQLTKQTDPYGAMTRYVYDAQGHIIQTIDPAGNSTSYEFDASGRLVKSVSPQGGTAVYGYDASGNLVSVADSQGNIIKTEYDKLGRITAIVDAAGNRTEYTLDAAGNLIAVKDPLGRSISNTYDATGRIITTTDALNRTIAYSYDASGNRSSATDAMGHVTRYEYDTGNRLSAVIDPLNNRVSYQYDANSNKTRETDTLGRTTSYEYSSANRLIKVTDPLGGITRYEYDSRGLKIKETWPDNRSSYYSYDNAGRLTASRDAGGYIVQYFYDSSGNLASKTDARGNTTRYEYDVMSRLVKVIDAEGGVWQYSYDEAGRLVGITNANGRITAFTYNKSGQLTAIIDALGNQTRFEYDMAGNMVRLTKPTNETQEYAYDAGNRITRAQAGGEAWNFIWNNDDLLAGFGNDVVSLSYDYDAGHRLTRASYNWLGKALLYTYDAAGNRTKLVRENGADVNYAYDALNRLSEISERNQIYRFTYDPAGRLTHRTYPTGITGIYAFDSAGRLETLEHRKSDGVLLSKFKYAYDPNGNKTSAMDSVGKYAYTYDKLDRLTKVVFPSGRTQEFSYDGTGNRTKLTQLWPAHLAKANGIPGTPVNGNVQETVNYTYDEIDRLVSAGDINYTHDTAGRLTRIQTPPNLTTTFDYDGFDRPVRITGLRDVLTGSALPTNEFVYAPITPNLSFTPAPLGSRLKKTDSRGVAQFIIDNTGNVLAELDANKSIKQQYLHTLKLDEPLSMTDEHGHSYYYLPDGVGSVSMLTDASGDPVQNYHYEPYGKSNVITRDKNPFKFTSREYDPDSQLQYHRARYYAPNLGRWITPDPLVLAPNSRFYEDRFQSPQQFNKCSYAGNNPLRFTDPSGLFIYDPATCGKITPALHNGAKMVENARSNTYLSQYFEKKLGVNFNDFYAMFTYGTTPDVMFEPFPKPKQWGAFRPTYPDRIFVSSRYLTAPNAASWHIAFTIIHELAHYSFFKYKKEQWDTAFPGGILVDTAKGTRWVNPLNYGNYETYANHMEGYAAEAAAYPDLFDAQTYLLKQEFLR